jgi:hypothetical protein
VYVANLLDEELEAHPQGATEWEISEPDRTCLETLGILSQFSEFRERAVQARV